MRFYEGVGLVTHTQWDRWGLERQSNDITWFPSMEAEVLPSYSWRGGGEADQRVTTVVPEGG